MNKLQLKGVLRLSNGNYKWDIPMYVIERQVINILLDEEDEQD